MLLYRTAIIAAYWRCNRHWSSSHLHCETPPRATGTLKCQTRHLP